MCENDLTILFRKRLKRTTVLKQWPYMPRIRRVSLVSLYFSFRKPLKNRTRVKRVKVGKGCYVLVQSDLKNLLKEADTMASKKFMKVAGVHNSNINLNEFKSQTRVAISSVLSQYGIFRSRLDFIKLSKVSIRNKLQDHTRNAFRKKRFGFEIPIVPTRPEEEAESSVENHYSSVISEDSFNPTYSEKIRYDDLFKDELSKEAYQTYLLCSTDPSQINRLKFSEEHKLHFQEMKYILKKYHLYSCKKFSISKLKSNQPLKPPITV